MEIEFKMPEEVVRLFKHAVYSVRLQGYEIYLGGGCLRDLYVGKPVEDIKDYDIFLIPHTGAQSVDVSHLKHCSVLSGDHIPDMKKRGVNCLIWWYDEVEYNFIVYGEYLLAIDLADDMDMGICQAMYPLDYAQNKKHRIIVSEHFVKDHSERRIKCYHDYKKSRMVSRYERMKEKFPSYVEEGKPDIKIYAKDGREKKMKAHY